MTPTDRSLRAAAFLTQALELELDPASVADDLAIVHEDDTVSTYAAELEASFGTAAFLIYVYDLGSGGASAAGRSRFSGDIDTLQTAAERDSPGPRLLAHAESDAEGYLLATTPATFRVLSGEATGPIEFDAPSIPPGAGAMTVRRDSAEDLLKTLRAANVAAGTWLAALQAGGSRSDAGPTAGDEDTIEFNEAETELALFLLDDRSIQNVLRAVNVFITAARSSTPPSQ